MKRHLSTRMLAAVLAVALVGVLSPVRAETLASLSGRVLSEDARTPLSGVVIQLTGPSDAVVKSDPTTAEGLFTLANLPPGIYRCTVETDEGLYQVTSSLRLEPGQSRSVQLALKKEQQPAVAGVGSAVGGGAGGGGAQEYAPLVGIGVILGTLGLAAALGDDDSTKKGSPSSPGE